MWGVFTRSWVWITLICWKIVWNRCLKGPKNYERKRLRMAHLKKLVFSIDCCHCLFKFISKLFRKATLLHKLKLSSTREPRMVRNQSLGLSKTLPSFFKKSPSGHTGPRVVKLSSKVFVVLAAAAVTSVFDDSHGVGVGVHERSLPCSTSSQKTRRSKWHKPVAIEISVPYRTDHMLEIMIKKDWRVRWCYNNNNNNNNNNKRFDKCFKHYQEEDNKSFWIDFNWSIDGLFFIYFLF